MCRWRSPLVANCWCGCATSAWRSRRTRSSVSTAVRPARSAPTRTPIILVVDDSFTTRTLEKSILEASGYQVRVAVDGQEAIESLRREGADLVVSDVEMPRLDGIGLTTAIKGDQHLAAIPVI